MKSLTAAQKETKTFIGLPVLFILAIIASAVQLYTTGTAAAADWSDPAWGYRKIITVDNNSNPNALTNYPAIVQLGSSNFDFNLAEPNGEDLRFTKDDGITPLDFWIEDYNSIAQSALVWVEIPSIPSASSVNIYMYYDNPEANPASNGTATFDLFDDFSGTTVDTGKWNSGGTPTLADGLLTVNSSGEYIRSKQTYQFKAFRCRSKFETYGNYGYIGFNTLSLNVGANDAMFLCFATQSVYTITSSSGYTWGDNPAYEGTGFKKWDILWKQGEIKFMIDGSLRKLHTTNIPTIGLYAQINDNAGSPIVKTDWVLVRNYSSPEPNAVTGAVEQCPAVAVPEFTSTPITDAFVDEVYTYDVDANGTGTLVYQLDVYPEGMIIDANTGVITWTPTAEQSGNQAVTVRVTDADGSAIQSYNVSVSIRLDLSKWMYKRQITIDNTSNTNDLTDYPVKIVLDETNFNFTDADVNGEDIRFTKEDGASIIDFWTEAWDSSANKAVVWAKVPYIAASSTAHIYMYYLNPDANNDSNGDATFSFFDDFDPKSYVQTGLGGDWPRVVVDNALNGSHNVLVEDVDGDNKPDLVADAYVAGVAVWYKQPADPINDPWTKYVIDSNLANAHDIQIGDIDGDGLRDVVGLSLSATSADYGAGEGYLCWYKKPVNPLTAGSSGWTSKASMPYSQGDGSAAIYNNEIYVFGGHYLGVSDPRNEAYKYNTTSNTWTRLADMPTARWGLIAVEFNGLIHVFSGNTASSATGVHEVYNPLTDTWTTGTDVPSGLANQGLMGIKYGDKIHLFYGQYHYAYDPNTDTYTSKANVPTWRTWATCALVDNKIYLIGGYSGGATNVNEVYDPTMDTWETKAPMPVSKYGVTREDPVINGKIYVTHGLDGGFHTDNYVYDPATNTWTQKSSGMNPRDGVQSAVINNKLYVIAGRNDYNNGGTGTNYIEEYDPVNDVPGNAWTKTIIAHSGSGGLLGARSMGLGDIDGDGDLDIAVAVDSGPGRLYWYANPGGADAMNPSLWQEYLIDATRNRGADAQIGDIDGDGNPDIAYADVPTGIYVYFAPSDPTNIGGWTRIQVAGDTYHVNFVDFDGDGDLDILRAGAYSALVSWLENPGGANARNPASWNEYIIEQDSSISIANRVSAADIDGDGDLDIGMDADPSGSTGIFKWYRRPANPKDVGAYQKYTIDSNPAYTAYAHDSFLADIDGDGRIDMAGVGPSAQKVMWWVNNPNQTPSSDIDLSKWSNNGATAVNGTVQVNTANAYIRSQTSFLYKAMRWKGRFAAYADYGDMGFNSGKVTVGKNDIAFTCFGTPTVQSITSNDTGFTWGYNQNEGTDWKIWDIDWRPNEVKFYVDDVLRQTQTSTVPSVPLTVQFNTYQGSPTVAADWVLVRNYSSPEPNAAVGPAIPAEFIVTASADANGMIDPNGDITKTYGQEQSFTASPNPGYAVDTWLLDGNNVQIGGSTYSLTQICANHTVYVTFKPLPSLTISGTTGLDGVEMNGLPGNPVTSSGGLYSATVPYDWSGTVTPTLAGYTFEPVSKSYVNVTASLTNENYSASSIMLTISGSAGLDGVVMNGLPGNPVTSGGGLYSVQVPYGWGGTVTPAKDGRIFEPSQRTYTNVTSSQLNQDYTSSSIYDLDLNGYIDIGDIAVMSSNWLENGASMPGDFNNDEVVNFNDFAVMAPHWREL